MKKPDYIDTMKDLKYINPSLLTQIKSYLVTLGNLSNTCINSCVDTLTVTYEMMIKNATTFVDVIR